MLAVPGAHLEVRQKENEEELNLLYIFTIGIIISLCTPLSVILSLLLRDPLTWAVYEKQGKT